MSASPIRTRPEWRLTARIFLLGALLLASLAYLPGIGGGFVFDDYNNILFNKDLKFENFNLASLFQAGWSGVAGPLKRPLAMMSFAVNFSTTGDFIPAFKITNLLIHLANGILMFIFLRILIRSTGDQSGSEKLNHAMLAAVAASIWLLHPLNLTSVLYVVQRMNSLSALFSLTGIICYCVGRQRLEDGRENGWWLIVGCCPMLIALAILCKENAVMTFPLIALIEICFFRLRTSMPRDRALLIGFFVVTLLVPSVLASLYVFSHPNFILGGYINRPFSMTERLLTEARVVWFYLALLLVPRLSQFGLYHDDYVLSTSIFDPVTTLPSIACLAVVVVLAVYGTKRYPIFSFAVGWYVAGHIMESSVIGLELVHEHRNYMPSIGIVFALCFGAARFFESGSYAQLQKIAVAAIIVLCTLLTYLRAGDWSDPATLAVVEAQRHPNSLRSVYDLGRIQFGLHQLTGRQEFYDQGIANLERSVLIDPSATRPLIGLLRMEYESGHTPRPEWMLEALERYENTLFHPSETDDLYRLVQCRTQTNCAFPARDVEQLYRAALRNSSVPKYSRAQLMVDLAVLYVNESYELEPAMNLLDDVVLAFPTEFNFRKIRAQIYLMAERYSEVAEETKYMRSISVWRDLINSPIDEISTLERAVADASKLKQPSP
ncbi:MAG: hypothetical protein O3C28_00180 [Proteobacteria bacterium]|nr:hypothetical protein [Pseudomonadota bacterium]